MLMHTKLQKQIKGLSCSKSPSNPKKSNKLTIHSPFLIISCVVRNFFIWNPNFGKLKTSALEYVKKNSK